MYEAYTYPNVGGSEHTVQVLMLDTRYNRSPLAYGLEVNEGGADKKAHCLLPWTESPILTGDYCPHVDSEYRNQTVTLLGEEQWAWLEQELTKPASLRVIGTSLSFGSTYTGWEGWSLFPREQERFVRLVQKTRASGVVFISGDVHYGEVSVYSQVRRSGSMLTSSRRLATLISHALRHRSTTSTATAQPRPPPPLNHVHRAFDN